jgi:hypothetical protein
VVGGWRLLSATYAVIAGYVGLALILAPTARQAATYQVAQRIAPLPVWGAAFATVGALIAGALLTRRDLVLRLAHVAAAVVYAPWAVGLGLSLWPLHLIDAVTAPVYPLGALIGHLLCAANTGAPASGRRRTWITPRSGPFSRDSPP